MFLAGAMHCAAASGPSTTEAVSAPPAMPQWATAHVALCAQFARASTPPSRSWSNRVVATSSAPAKSAEKPWAKTLIGGGCTILFEAFGGGHLLEFLKISKQTNAEASYAQLFRNVTQHKGIVGVLDGFLPWGLLQAVTKGAVFSFGHAESKTLLLKYTSMSKDVVEVAAGGMGGFVQGVFMSPLLLLKTRVMTDPSFRTQGSMMQTSMLSAQIGKQVIAREGAMALMKGAGVFSGKRFADWTTRYLFVAIVEKLYKGEREAPLSATEQVLCSLGGGTLSALSTVPIDVMVATVQQASKAGEKVSIVQVYKQQMASGGIKGTLQMSTRGLVARVAHVALTTLLMKTMTSWTYDLLMR